MCKRFIQFITDIFNTPSKLLLLCTCWGILTCVLMLFVPIFYRDSVAYIAVTRAVQLKNWTMALDLTIIPGPFLLASPLLYLGFNEMQALTILSSLFGTALIFPCYGVLCFYMRKKYAAWGTAAFFFLPDILQISFAPLTDSGRWFFFFLCWYLILCYLHHRKWQTLVWLGLAYTGFSLVRSEGIVAVLLFSGWFFFELCRKKKEKEKGQFFRKFAGNVLITGLPLLLMLVLLSPRMYQCYRETGYPSLDLRQTWAIQGIVSRILPQEPAENTVKTPLKDGTKTYENYHTYFDEFALKSFQKRYWGNVFSGCVYPYLILAAIGAFVLIRNRKWKDQYTLFLSFLLINAAVYYAMRSCAGRYFYIHAFLVFPLALYGARICFYSLYRHSPPSVQKKLCPLLVTVLLVLLCICMLKGLDNMKYRNQEYYLTVGKFMQEYTRTLQTRSGLPHPVYLIIGENYGWGFQCRGNEIFYNTSRHLNTLYTVEEILKEGVPVKYCYYACDSFGDTAYLKPDFLLLADCREKPVLSRELQKSLTEIHLPENTEDIQIFRVQPEKIP